LIDKDDIQVWLMSNHSEVLIVILAVTWWLKRLGRHCQ